MKKILHFSVIILAVISFTRCKGRRPAADLSDQTVPTELRPLELPRLPALLASPQEQAEYLALHYWDNFDFADTLYIDSPEITEQAFSDYLAIVGVNPPEVAGRSIANLIDRTTVNTAMYRYFSELFENYLDDPNSPLRNEELYILVLENIIALEKVDQVDKLRPRAKLESALKNRVGTRAADIVLTDENGSKVRLYDIAADHILLYFNNPDCIHCERMTANIKGSLDMLVPLVNQGVLKIVTIYPDEDLDAWRKHLDDIPSNWLRTYDGALSIRSEYIYDIRAIPSLYLLDRDKTVLLKDVDNIWLIEDYFARLGY
ncbi:MAG: DUF5106 domain-containing protein [Rikenellaceae bacterium]|nr:DUF5106 domain-containing protein [Rikenellaceae bacterium]